jgi:hypothetical protein
MATLKKHKMPLGKCNKLSMYSTGITWSSSVEKLPEILTLVFDDTEEQHPQGTVNLEFTEKEVRELYRQCKRFVDALEALADKNTTNGNNTIQDRRENEA